MSNTTPILASGAERLALQAKGIFEQADREGRALTGDERTYVAELLDRAKSQHEFNSDLKGLGLGVGMEHSAGYYEGSGGGPGDIFVNSTEYKKIRDPGGRGHEWSTGPIQVSRVALHAKGTLLETGVGGPGGGAVPPAYEPGIVSKLFEPLGVADVFGSSQTTASQIRYAIEGTATSGAAGVAEAGVKPESTIAMSETTETIRKIATVLPVSDEFLEDAPSIQSYLNDRLGLFVKLEEERQCLRGAGSGSNELLGIFGRSGINQYTKLAADNNAEALAKVIANTAGSSFVAPDTVILHPGNWLSTRLLRAGTAGEYFGGGPFGGAYSGNSPGLFGQQIWNVRVVLSTHVGSGTALVGNFGQAAHIWRRGGVTIDASNSHSDFYVRNLSMLRAEERLGLGCFRPVVFTEVRGLA